MKKYSSFYGSVTIAKAVKLVGIDHALHACTCDDWQEIIQRQMEAVYASCYFAELNPPRDDNFRVHKVFN